jgi:3-oxoacyl-ACP reductase-like protein
MSFFDKIKNAIFGKAEAAPQTSAPAGTPAATASPAAPAAPAPTAAAPAPAGNVDVASILDAAVKQNGQKLDWKHSIVDLLKALNLDSSLSARKELAGELGYTTMNIWLHKAVIKKLSENGGKVPADLLD